MMFGEQGTKILFALLLAGFIGKFSYSTMNEFLEQELFHNKWLRAAGGILMTIPLVCTVGAQAIGIGTILNVVMGVDVITGIWVAALTAILYTVMGGMWAIVWTDLVQGIASLICGGGTVIVFEVTPSLFKIFGGGIIPGIMVSLVTTVGISLIENAMRKSPGITR